MAQVRGECPNAVLVGFGRFGGSVPQRWCGSHVRSGYYPLFHDDCLLNVRQVSVQVPIMCSHLVGKACQAISKKGTWAVHILGWSRLSCVFGRATRPAPVLALAAQDSVRSVLDSFSERVLHSACLYLPIVREHLLSFEPEDW